MFSCLKTWHIFATNAKSIAVFEESVKAWSSKWPLLLISLKLISLKEALDSGSNHPEVRQTNRGSNSMHDNKIHLCTVENENVAEMELL